MIRSMLEISEHTPDSICLKKGTMNRQIPDLPEKDIDMLKEL